MTNKIRALIEDECSRMFVNYPPDPELFFNEGAKFGFALAVEMHKGAVEALKFYGDESTYHGIETISPGPLITDSGFSLFGGTKEGYGMRAREALAGLKEQLGE